MALPMTKIGGLEICRLICGSNPFGGFSHFSKARSVWMNRYFTVERVLEVLVRCCEHGINAVVSGINEKLGAALERLHDETDHQMHWICTPGGPDLKTCLEGTQWCADHNVSICMPHPSYTDANLDVARGVIRGADEICAKVRELGMIPGFSTHRPETVTVGDKAGYDIETYIQLYNAIGFLVPVETDWAARVITGSPKPIICIKPLAAGRILPPTAFTFVYHTIKPIDTVACGFLSVEEVDEDVQIVQQILAGRQVDVELQETRSKSGLK